MVREQTAAIVSLLADRGTEMEVRVHEARRQLKRLRALLRLVRLHLSEEVYLSESKALRNTARRLSKARDSEVALLTLEAFAADLPKAEADVIRALLADSRQRAHQGLITAAHLPTLAGHVRTSGHRIADAELQADEWPLLALGLQQSYRSARRLRGSTKGDDQSLHEWRKRVKRLAAHLELFRRILAKPERKTLDCLIKLGDELGNHHDLVILARALSEFAAHGLIAANSKTLNRAIRRESEATLRKIKKLGRTAFRGRTKAFLAAVHQSWKRWRKRKTS